MQRSSSNSGQAGRGSEMVEISILRWVCGCEGEGEVRRRVRVRNNTTCLCLHEENDEEEGEESEEERVRRQNAVGGGELAGRLIDGGITSKGGGLFRGRP